MSVETLCQVCQAAPADHRCPRCATMVCEDHFDAPRGLCQGCMVDEGGPA